MLPFQNLHISQSLLASLVEPQRSRLSDTAGDTDEKRLPSFSVVCHNSKDQAENSSLGDSLDDEISTLFSCLRQRGIQAQKPSGICPPEAIVHDQSAVVPALVVSPLSEWGVVQTLELFNELKLYGRVPISIKSGGHGYHNGASCPGVMLNLGRMTGSRIVDDTLFIEPGCLLGQLVSTLANAHKAVPHGDCFGVGAGGHFTTAGWDLLLARRYGLGCQSVIGGRVALWDGSVVEVNDESHPDLLFAMRGGAVAGVGVVTEIRLRLLDEPSRATWRFTRINEHQLRVCVANQAFAKAINLPQDISVSFRFHFEPDQLEPVCSFNIVSLLGVDETVRYLQQHLGPDVTSIVAERSEWNEKGLLDLRMLPASDIVAANPGMLREICSHALHENPLLYWKRTSSLREMARSFFTSISHWVIPDCDTMLLELYHTFQSVQLGPARERMYALVIHGGGQMLELQKQCSMPLGQTLARFELHWDTLNERRWCQEFTSRISNIIGSQADPGPQRPYRGDI